MQNKNIATCDSAAWNSAIQKKSATRKNVKTFYMKRWLLHKKINMKNAVWKDCNMKKAQLEKI